MSSRSTSMPERERAMWNELIASADRFGKKYRLLANGKLVRREVTRPEVTADREPPVKQKESR